jgi:type I restriction enzyme S subunit
MSFPRYPKYKGSGVEWLGEVPEHWEVSYLKRIVAMPITDGPHETPQFVDEGVPFVSAEAVSSGKIDFSKIRACISNEDNARYSQKYSPKLHDIFMVKSGATTGTTAIVEDRTDFNIWSPLAVIRCNEEANPHFILNFMRSRNFQEAVTLNWSFGTQQNIGMGVIENLPCTLPPFAEQAKIAEFLDQETGKIDELVAEQQRLMELLKEKRQVVISHAVTKGLNPRAPMKPSGIEWLGEVPAHWEVKSLKYLMSLTSGGTPSKENLAYWDGAVPWASSKDLKTDELFDTQDHITQEALDDGAADLVPPGSILTVVRGMILLHTFPVVVARVPMAINQDLKAILPTAGVDADFLAWLLRGASDEVLSRTDEAGHGTKVLRMETWLAMQVPVPPLKEQTLIVANIIERLGELDALAAEAQKAIDLLQERRTALISAAVTGQIDVRKLAAA